MFILAVCLLSNSRQVYWCKPFLSNFKLNKQVRCKLVACQTGMNACISVGKLTEARQLLQDMKQRNIALDIRVFNILLKGYSRRGGVSAVPGVLQEMTDAGLKPSAVTYNTLIDTYVTAGQLAQARQTCADAQAAGVAPSHP